MRVRRERGRKRERVVPRKVGQGWKKKTGFPFRLEHPIKHFVIITRSIYLIFPFLFLFFGIQNAIIILFCLICSLSPWSTLISGFVEQKWNCTKKEKTRSFILVFFHSYPSRFGRSLEMINVPLFTSSRVSNVKERRAWPAQLFSVFLSSI